MKDDFDELFERFQQERKKYYWVLERLNAWRAYNRDPGEHTFSKLMMLGETVRVCEH